MNVSPNIHTSEGIVFKNNENVKNRKKYIKAEGGRQGDFKETMGKKTIWLIMITSTYYQRYCFENNFSQ